MLALQTYGHCINRTGTRIATAPILRTRTISDMGALDKRLYTSHHTPTDTVARVGPACVKLALNGCSYLQSTARLSLQRDSTYNPHPCTVLTAAHNIHTFPPDAPACLAYQRTLMNPYCMSDMESLQFSRSRSSRR